MPLRAALVFAAMLAASAAGSVERPAGFSAASTSVAPISGVEAARGADFAIAMLRYRHTEAQRRWRSGPFPLIGEVAANQQPLLWRAADGSHVERVAQDRFRLTLAGASGLFRSVDCRLREWPQFDCSDGVRRAMSAPAPNRLVFGGLTFDRLLARPGPGLVAGLE